MIKSEEEILECDINLQISKKLKSKDNYILRELRLHPCEIDIVILDPISLKLTALEIKRNKWNILLHQAHRAQLYCHYSFAVIPNSKRNSIPTEEFIERGIGIIFYKKHGKELELFYENMPQLSSRINRTFKQQVYNQFYNKFGDIILC